MEEKLTEEMLLKKKLFRKLSAAAEPDGYAMEMARRRWDSIGKPLHSLGALEDAIVKMAGVQRSCRVRMNKNAVVVMCGDHGVLREGVAQTDSSVTRTVAENIAAGSGCISIMARNAGANVFVVDMGIDCPPYHETRIMPVFAALDIIDRKIGRGTGDIAAEAAMTKTDCIKAVLTGIDIAEQLAARGYQIIATGEMGIGNTTPSSALASVLLDLPAEAVTGRGAGISADALKKKTEVVERAVGRYWKAAEGSPIPEGEFFSMEAGIELMSQLGGYEIAGMTGLCLGAQTAGVTVLLDGFISTTAALCAALFSRNVSSFLLASHVSAEPAGRMILKQLGLRAVIDAGMCLGEGTGAAASLGLYRSALDIYTNMKTFDQIKVEQYEDFS